MGNRNGAARNGRVFVTSVIGSIVASLIFVVIIQPISIALRVPFIDFVSFIFKGLVDACYEQAKFGATDEMLFMIFGTLVTIMISTSVSLLLTRFQKFSNFLYSLSFLQLGRVDGDKKSGRGQLAAFLLFNFFGLFAGLYLVISAYITVQASASFRVRLEALGPVLTAQEEKGIVELRNRRFQFILKYLEPSTWTGQPGQHAKAGNWS